MNLRSSLFRFTAAGSLAVVLAAGSALAARDWINRPVLDAAEEMLAAMPDGYYAIKPMPAAEAMTAEDIFVVDVREPMEFEAEHIAGAKNIPIRKLAALIDTLPKEKGEPIVIYCRTGHRAAIGLSILKMLGYTNVRSISGGLEGWKATGLPVTESGFL